MLSRLEILTHIGTHIDAPCHFLEAGGWSVEEIPLEHTIGKGRVVPLTHLQGRECITADEIIKTGVGIDDSIIPVLYTGWTDRAWDTDEFWGNTVFLDTTAAEYIVEKGCKAVALDCFPEAPFWLGIEADKPPGRNHKTLLGNKTIIIQLVSNVGKLAGKDFTLYGIPLPLEGLDGSPARVRACHVHGVLNTKDNKRPAFTVTDALDAPTRDIERIVLPPYNYQHETEKTEQRWPAAVKFIEENSLNEVIDGRYNDVGIIVAGGLYNTLNRAMEHVGCSDVFGNNTIPMYIMNVAYPVVDAEVIRFCQGKKAVLMVEEGQPDYLEQNINTILRRHDVQARLHGKDVFTMAGEYTCQLMEEGLRKFLLQWEPAAVTVPPLEKTDGQGREELTQLVPQRPSGLCTGCPERPFFSAVKLLEKEYGKLQVSMDIGCHSFATVAPFNIGNTITGYGLGPSSASALMVPHEKRALSIMGDGGFWHNGLTTGVGNAVENEHDGIIIVVDNGYSAATGGQWIPSSRADADKRQYRVPIVDALKGAGVKWIREVHTYNIQESLHALREAMTTRSKGPKLIVAEGECQLNRQRRIKPQIKNLLKQKKRYVRERFGIDEDTCTGDHSCIRLSGCPSLTIKDNPDPLRKDPVATVVNSCVGCGVCGEVAHAAVLCPSFYKADIVYNPNLADRAMTALRSFAIGKLQAWSDMRRRNRSIGYVNPAGLTGDGLKSVPTMRPSPSLPVLKQGLSGDGPRPGGDMITGKQAEPIKVAILAMGGQGGGVLSNWLIKVAEQSGYLAQSTSVPGVAQRTGATVYYLEFFPREAIGDMPAVLALTPVPGRVDVVLAGELIEGGRAILRGLISPDRTTALVSTHRDYAIGEKTAMGDGRADSDKITGVVMENAKHFIGFDMNALAEQTGSVISSVLLGAVAGSGALPFRKETFTETIGAAGVAVEANLEGFPVHEYTAIEKFYRPVLQARQED